MIRTLVRLALVAVIPFSLASCSSGALVPERQSMPAARASLLPEYRIFYDSMQDYGDWILIEPYGYVFRPQVNFVAWRPYQDGFWAPNDVYGWTWISSEPFGWATYHYGRWTYDQFQGWVWVPGADWGPAWVTWNGNDNYVGWAPQLAGNVNYGSIPGGAFTYVPVNKLGSADVAASAIDAAKEPGKLAELKPIVNPGEVNGVRINKGPSLDWVESKVGNLQRVRIQDLVAPGDRGSLRPHGAGAAGHAGGDTGGAAPAPKPNLRHVTSADSTRSAAEAAAREARELKARGGTVDGDVKVVRPFGVDDRTGASAPPHAKPAPKPAK